MYHVIVASPVSNAYLAKCPHTDEYKVTEKVEYAHKFAGERVAAAAGRFVQTFFVGSMAYVSRAD